MTLRSLSLALALCLLAAPAIAQEREWTLDASDQDAYLIFGVPESDDVGISLWCSIGKGMVNVFVPETTERSPSGKAVDMTVTAGDEAATFKAKTETNEETGSWSAEAEVPATHPIFSAMEKADRLKVKVGASEAVFPLFEPDLPGLLALCRKN